MDMEELDMDALQFNQSKTFEVGNNSVRFPKFGLKINQEGIETLDEGTKIQPGLNAITPDQIQIGDVIGKGVSSYVCQGLYVPFKQLVAIKIINVFDKDKRHQMINDLRTFLTGYDCKNLINFIGAYYEEGTIKIVLEYMDQGSLRNVIQKVHEKQAYKLVDEGFLATITKEILIGLWFLHSKKHQVHRDIKPENILFDSSGSVKLTDFGISKQLEKTYAITNTFIGTLCYMSPERINGKTYSYQSDLWSVGILLIELASGKHPYVLKNQNQSYIELIQRIIQQPSPTLDGQQWTNDFLNFLTLCLEKDDKKRPDCETLLKHKWIIQTAKDDQYLRDWIKKFNCI